MASGAFDIYVLFVELGLRLLAPEGRLGYILPNKFMKLAYGQKLRELLVSSRTISEVIDFDDAQVFDNVTTYTAILTLDRAGAQELTYRKLLDTSRVGLRDALAAPAEIPLERFAVGQLGGESWTLLAGEEAALMRTLGEHSTPLGELAHIFQGLITSADSVYIVERRGTRNGQQIVYSKASDSEFVLERDFLHPLASGAEVGMYAFNPLTDLLLFPYVREGTEMRLATEDELAGAPNTLEYLRSHEETLRARERGKMDHAGWYAFGRHQGLGLHDSPKLGVPRMCEHLRASADTHGGIYLDNVDVNGLVLETEMLMPVCALLNSRALDWAFRRGSVPFRGNFMSANKQFLAPLPVCELDGEALDTLTKHAQLMHELESACGDHKQQFLDWLGSRLGVRIDTLKGKKKIKHFERHEAAQVLAELRKNRDLPGDDPGSIAFFNDFTKEFDAVSEVLNELRGQVVAEQDDLDSLVFDLYGLTASQVTQVNREYP